MVYVEVASQIFGQDLIMSLSEAAMGGNAANAGETMGNAKVTLPCDGPSV